jgi:hypothetical protein
MDGDALIQRMPGAAKRALRTIAADQKVTVATIVSA